MKNYSCRTFTNVNDLLNWLNKEQEYINIVSIMHLDKSFYYEVIFYTEEEERVAYQPSNDGYRSPLYRGTYGVADFSFRLTRLTESKNECVNMDGINEMIDFFSEIDHIDEIKAQKCFEQFKNNVIEEINKNLM